MSGFLSAALSLANGLHSFSDDFTLSLWIFLRALGIVYLCAFFSLAVQIRGLIGEEGILPLGDYLNEMRSHFGKKAYRHLPTLFWFRSDDKALLTVTGIGMAASLSLILGIGEFPCLIILFICYLSLTVAGQDFLSFQWDVLLIETGFLAIFLGFSPFGLLLLWWLIFRLMFESGAVKLSCGDETWRRLSSLEVHYQTQPLPHRVAWYFHWLPAPLHRFGVAMVLVIEIVLPFFIFAPAPFRHLAAAGFLFLMLVIFITGNYTFFNILTAALSLPLLDDSIWRPFFSPALISHAESSWAQSSPPASFPVLWLLHGCLTLFILVISVPQVIQSAFPDVSTPRWIQKLQRFIQSFHLVNSYGLFRHMTTTRPEIILEGSMDGHTWKAYEFRYKPGNLAEAPRFVAPHQPRLDWQMWFAALSSFYRTIWFQRLILKLFEGAEPVQRLLKTQPFSTPPRYIRALLYEYEFTNAAERKARGHWWKRKTLGAYAPVMMRRDPDADAEGNS
ncbi:MAG TPA: lipase maturation factor family protein [Oligoflexus sp.]|uniref:lipase maturation factor family protein n=1 Tax=Oligoflexus sp. TaxID=1971216 RepID=UPI002D80FBA2|nr:lipase maturation factor family protein [Oligoflexus sp.]HET9236526.1 lipase maturation factor family protein [Oligoflexus sp.]